MSEALPTEPAGAREILARLARAIAHPHVIAGASGSLGAAFTAEWGRAFPNQTLVHVVASDDGVAPRLADLGFFLSGSTDNTTEAAWAPVEWPILDEVPYSELQPDRRALMQRMALLALLDRGEGPRVLVASAAALFRRVVPPEAIRPLSLTVRVGDTITRDALALAFTRAGYGRAPTVEDGGTFAVRGAVVDVFPPCYRQPVRVELFGDEIESIRHYEPSTQRTVRTLDSVFIHPVRETLESPGADPRTRLLEAADAASQPSAKTRHMLDQIALGSTFLGIEALAPLFHPRMATLFDYLPANVRFAIDDRDAVLASLRRTLERWGETARGRHREHRIALPPEAFFMTEAEAVGALANRPRLDLAPLAILGARSDGDGDGPAPVQVDSRPTASLRSDPSTRSADAADGEAGSDPGHRFAARLRRWLSDGYAVRLVARNRTQSERLAALCEALELPVALDAPADPASTRLGTWLGSGPRAGFRLVVGGLSTGFDLPRDRLLVITEEDVFGVRARRDKPVERPGGDTLAALREGDPVVHEEHGVGLYRGLRKLDVRGVTHDFVQLEYQDGTAYVPVYRLGLVRPFSAAAGAEGEAAARPIRLDRLGGKTWQEKRRRASNEARKLAEELLQLYAQRAALPGHAYPAPDTLFRAFEETFPFEETPDQARAIAAVLDDLQSDRPMDRLVCGDVGYGKTEIALRAALLAVEAGKQVAVLAPTTILVEQHLLTFRERLRDFPARVDSLSRFRSVAEQRKTVADLAAGRVDIAIGTHRLLSHDVRWKNLGLVIVDEEQRFGVAHKERLKALRTDTDVLTLTATPIPRTLQMAMGGLREISIIATPPVDRLAIRTFVCHFDRDLLREAMARELARGGQVFFVHNRVADLDQTVEEVRAMLPTARVAAAHGQMPEGKLEAIMVDFVDGRFDVLCCTTIIESGLDIPRANTMIVNHADRFGLAQLYQMRGRIGRARERAYCYLVVPDDSARMTDEARQRIAVLQRFSELGAGFQIASHDLEIRGAGELLGARQSGALASVGFEAYVRLLEEAVAELRGQPIKTTHDPEVVVDVPAFLPDDYVSDTGQRLDLYRRLAQASDPEAVDAILSELADRFGPLPAEAVLLGAVMIDKTIVRRIGAVAYELAPHRLVLTLATPPRIDLDRLLRLVQRPGSRFRILPDSRLSYSFDDAERADRMAAARTRLLQIESEAMIV